MASDEYLPVEAKPVRAVQWLERDHLAMIKVMTTLGAYGLWAELHATKGDIRLIITDGSESVASMGNRDWAVFTESGVPEIFSNSGFRSAYTPVTP